MSEPVSLASRRADKSGDCRDWKPLDALRELIEDIEAGRRNPSIIYVAMESDIDAKGEAKLGYVCAGGSRTELVGLLARHVNMTCKDA